MTFGGAEGSVALLPRFFDAVAAWEAGFGGLIVAAGEIVSGLAVAGASTGGVGIGAGLLCVDILVDGELGIGRRGEVVCFCGFVSGEAGRENGAPGCVSRGKSGDWSIQKASSRR